MSYGPVIQLALRRAKQRRGHLVPSIVAASKDFTLGRVNTPVAKMQAHQLHRFVDLQASDGIFKLLDSSGSGSHPNVPDAGSDPHFLSGPARVESTGCPDLGGCVRYDNRPRSFEPPSAMKSLRTGSTAASRIA